ncbi:hypothetical protein SOVF_004120 [Spinacia oleracea]|nr:hypothetical protein SOVF_004120 [Spinacia oleracea]
MDFDANYREKFPSHLPLFFPENNYSKPPRNDQFSLEEANLSLKGNTNFLQDLHPLENFDLNLDLDGSSSASNALFPIQPNSLEPYDLNYNSTFGCFPNFELYETKPFANHAPNNNNNVALGSNLIDNYNQSGGGLGILGHSQFINPINNMISSPSPQSYNPFCYYDLGLTRSSYRLSDEDSSTTPQNDATVVVPSRLSAATTKDVWSEEEDRVLIESHIEIGNKWAEIAKKLPGRTENSIKNHWNATKRRQFSRRKCKSKYPRQSSLLQEYIKSLTLETINAGCRKKPISFNNNQLLLPNNDDQTGSSNSSSSDPLIAPEYDFSEVPDFNFDAQMFEESSIDSLLDYAPPNNDHGGGGGGGGGGDGGGRGFFEIVDDSQIGLGPRMMVQHEVKKEFDLVEMINHVNL